MNPSTNKITVIIPNRMSESPDITLNSLADQTFKEFKTVVVYDEGKGANYARNAGFKQCDTEFVLFSDNDIKWKPNALEVLYQTLNRFRLASYAYGRFMIGDKIWGHVVFDPARLRVANYISTMSLIRTKDFPGFDENIKRYQDWDLWLTMLEQGKRGAYCNELIFTTETRRGISAQHAENDFEMTRIINDKHNLGLARFKTGSL